MVGWGSGGRGGVVGATGVGVATMKPLIPLYPLLCFTWGEHHKSYLPVDSIPLVPTSPNL